MFRRATLLGTKLHRYRESPLGKTGLAVSWAVPEEDILPARIRRVLAIHALAYPEVKRNADQLVRHDMGHQPSAMAPGRGRSPVSRRREGHEADRLRRMPTSQSIAMALGAPSAGSAERDRAKLEVGRKDRRDTQRRPSDQVISPHDLHHGRSGFSGRSRSLLQHGLPSVQANHRRLVSRARMVR